MRKQDIRDITSSQTSEIDIQEGKSGNPEARDQCRLGNLYAESDVYEYAVDAYKRAINLDPQYATAHHNLGVAYYKMGLFDEAQEEINTAIHIRPDVAKFHYTLGLVLKDDKKLTECIESFGKAIELDPNYIEAYSRRGLAYFYIGELEKASYDYKRVVEINPLFRDALHNLGIIYISLKKWDDAELIFQKQLEIRPNDSDALYYLALIYAEGRNQHLIAIEKLQEVLNIDPDHLNARFYLSLIYARNRYKEPSYRGEAINHLLALINIYNEFPNFEDIHSAYFLLGGLYDDSPLDIDLAIEAYQKGLEIADWSAEAHNNLGVLYSQKGWTDKAIYEFRTAIKLDPDYASPYYNLAKIYFYQRNDEIIRDFQLWIDEASGNSAKIFFNLSIALMDIGRAEACESVYSKAHRIKNLIGVAGSKLRRISRSVDPEISKNIAEILADQEKCYDEMVDLLGTLKHESLVLDTVDVNLILQSAISQVGFKSDDKGKLYLGNVSCSLEFTSDLPKIKGDARKLKEAFSNIIINAIEAMTNGIGSLYIKTRYSNDTSNIEIIFHDTGIGIPPQDIDNIFKPGYTTKNSGSGFGLSIVDRIIKEHKGGISISSSMGEGTEIIIYIPVNLELAPIQTGLRMRPVIYEDPSKLISTELDQIVQM
ncbi:MAG: tetratricopeptide repeat protein [Candidatus Poribacteria bacterium]